MNTPFRYTSMPLEVAPFHERSTVCRPCTLYPSAVSVIWPGVGVGIAVGVGVGVGVAVGVGVGVAVGVGVTLGAAVGVGVDGDVPQVSLPKVMNVPGEL